MTNSIYQRIDFAEAISEPLLLKSAWDKLSKPQQSALRIFYGLPLDEDGLRHWAIFNEFAKFDELGFPITVEKPPFDYIPREHDEAWVVFGRRSAKTSGFLAFILVYEALLGGHTQYASKKQQVVSFFVAQKLDIAQAALRDFVEPLISSSKLLEKEIVKENTDGIILKNGHRIAPAPPVIKNFRYFAIPVAVLDECAFWYKDAESANPDYEVIRAVEPAQGQFPNRKIIGASTVWTKEGIIWEAANAGTYGRKLQKDDERKPKFKNSLVLIAPTPALENPLYSDRKWFHRQLLKDPDAYRREYLVQFTDSVAGLFSENLLRKAVEGAPLQREPVKGNYYVAALDPAFRGDDFAFTIGHYEREKGFVQDLLKRWQPKSSKLNPSVILDEIALDLKYYDVETAYTDQHQQESLQQLALDRGFVLSGMDFTTKSKPKLFSTFLQLLRGGRINLLRDHEQFQQFLFIQRVVGNTGYVRISAPPGKHDDMVMVTVLCCGMAVKMEPDLKVEETKVITPFDEIMAKLMVPKQPDAEFL